MGLWAFVRSLPARLSGSGRRRPYLSAMDVWIAQRDEQIEELARRVADYESRVQADAELRRRRGEGGPWTGPGTRSR